MAFTLRHKVNGAIIITFALIAFVYTFIFLAQQKHRGDAALRDVETLLEALVERDTEELANEIFDHRFKAIAIRIDEMRKVRGIQGISIFDHTGKLLVSNGNELIRQDIGPKEKTEITRAHLIREETWQQRGALLFLKEIRFLGEHLGYIRIHYSLEEMENDRRLSHFLYAGLLLTIFFLMLIVLNWILSRAILHPITYLEDATRNIVQGDLEKTIDMKRRDELGNLAQSFETMRDAVKEKISDLKRITSIIESTSDLVSIATPDKAILYMNRAGRQMMGWYLNVSLKDRYLMDLHPEDAFGEIETNGLPTAVDRGTWEGESLLLRSDGTKIPVSLVLISHTDNQGRLEYISAIMRDISQTKAAENELRYLRNYLGHIIDSMPSILVGVDRDGRVTQWNQAAQKATGLSAAQSLGMKLDKVLPDMGKEMEKVMEAIQFRSLQFSAKVPRKTGDQIRYEDVTIYPLEREGMEGAVIRIDDVTDKVHFEEMMIQGEKMLSVGGLAAGMAHEINNPLAGIIQTASVMGNRLALKKSIPANIKAAENAGTTVDAISRYMEARQIPKFLDAINESGLRIASIVGNMLNFSRKSDTSFSTQDPVDLMDKVLELAATDFDLKKHFDFKSIEIIRQYETDLPDVMCEGSKIQQVLLNLLSNGAHAMSATPDPKFTIRIGLDASGMLKMEVEDNGPGMEENIRKRIFEPFFTTKPVGIGTGLGLAVSYFIITEHHNGKMEVVSKPGEGSNFIIHLPLEQG
ncbi:MAG: PAS domain S-box protein [Desulfobacter sp.]|nr:MAG: PAS domain S-box protein [Desulfobacter sp.]